MVAELMQRCIADNASQMLDQGEYLARYNSLSARFEGAKEKLSALELKLKERNAKAEEIGGFMFELMEHDNALTSFDVRLWLEVVDHATLYHDGKLTFKFRNDSEVTVAVELFHYERRTDHDE